MNHRIAIGGLLGVALLASSVLADKDLKSGPQVGEPVRRPFNVTNVTGRFAPQKLCLV